MKSPYKDQLSAINAQDYRGGRSVENGKVGPAMVFELRGIAYKRYPHDFDTCFSLHLMSETYKGGRSEQFGLSVSQQNIDWPK